MSRRRSMTGIGKGLDAFFDEAAPALPTTDSQAVDPPPPVPTTVLEEELIRATFYIDPDQHNTLEELRISLRRQAIKTNKSELIREAIELIAELGRQDLPLLAARLTQRQNENK